jgi:hypothetical protein
LSCITLAQLYVAGKQPGETEALALSDDPLPLYSGRLGTVKFVLGHQFRLVHDDEDWHVSTTAYTYYLLDSNDHELIAWHWHPRTVAHPHIHVDAGVIGRRMHIPTGRVSIESVLRMLVDDLGVPTRRENFREVFEEAERNFIEHRRWHA